MSAALLGRVAFAEADAKPGHYYVSVRDERGRTALALGPFTQPSPGGPYAHARALGLLRTVRHIVEERDWRNAPWYQYGTCRLPLQTDPPQGKLNQLVREEK